MKLWWVLVGLLLVGCGDDMSNPKTILTPGIEMMTEEGTKVRVIKDPAEGTILPKYISETRKIRVAVLEGSESGSTNEWSRDRLTPLPAK